MFPLKPIIPTIIVGLAICGAPCAKAEKPGPKGESNRPPGAGDRHEREEPRHTTVESVSADSISIQGAKGSKSFKITKDTVFTFKGKTVKADELKPGMRVSVSAGVDPTVAARIAADDPPKESEHPGDRKGDREPGGPKGPGDRGPGGEKPKR